MGKNTVLGSLSYNRDEFSFLAWKGYHFVMKAKTLRQTPPRPHKSLLSIPPFPNTKTLADSCFKLSTQDLYSRNKHSRLIDNKKLKSFPCKAGKDTHTIKPFTNEAGCFVQLQVVQQGS